MKFGRPSTESNNDYRCPQHSSQSGISTSLNLLASSSVFSLAHTSSSKEATCQTRAGLMIFGQLRELRGGVTIPPLKWG